MFGLMRPRADIERIHIFLALSRVLIGFGSF